MADNTSNFQTTQTFLIECSRADSLIDTKESADFNSKWTNATNFNLRRGDVVSVEAITLAAKNASGAGTIEFTGDKVFIDGTEKPYCDNKVLLEVMFYMNNNNTYSCGLPFVHPEGSFNNNPFSANMPILRDDGGTVYYGGLPSSFGSDGYLGQAFYGGVVNATIDPTLSYTIFNYNIGTVDNPNYVPNVPPANPPTPIASVVLSGANDGAPAASLKCNSQAIQTAPSTAADTNCNILPGNQIAIATGAAVDDFIIFEPEIENMRAQNIVPNTGRLELVFAEPISASGVDFLQFRSLAAVPSARDGSSELGNIHYSNIDQTGMAGAGEYRRHERIINLAANCFGVPQAGVAAGDRHNFFPNSTYGGPNGNNTMAYDYEGNKQGFRNGAIRHECNGKPYIWTRNDYFGMGAQKRNSKGFFPKLMPMTAFILLEADELFTDLTTLANTINDKLHEALSPFDNTITNMDNYLTDKVSEPTPQFKGSSVVPLINSFGYYDPNLYNNNTYSWKNVYKALWTDVLPVKYGGFTKVQPANFQAGRDFIDEGIGRIQEDLGTDPRSGDNCYLTDVIDFKAYGKEARIGNYIYGNMGYLEIYKMMFGDRLMRVDVYPVNASTYSGAGQGVIATRNIGRPVMLNTRLQITTTAVPLPNTNVYATITKLKRFETIFTNMKFPTYFIDADGNKVLNYDPEVWEDLAKSIRDYELYINKDPATSATTYETQKLDYNGWAINLDCGITDDYNSSFTQSKNDNIEPITPAWMRFVPPAADIANSGLYGTGISNLAPGVLGYREVISPSFSYAFFGDDASSFSWADNWNAYRGIGKLNVMSRFDPDWRNTSKVFSNVVAGQVDPACEIIRDTDPITNEGYLDIDLIQRLNLPFVPGKYTDVDGNKLYVCAWRVATNYGEDFNPFNTSTIQLGCLCWGLPLGVSSSKIDNHAIYCINGDQNNSTNPIKNTSSGSVIQPYRAYIENQTPFVVMGANNPTFQYNTNKNRFEFLNLQTDNLLSSLNTSSNSPSTNPQIGEKCGIIAGQQKDALFNIPNPQTRATSADNYTDPIKNQGIRAEIGGVSIFKIHLCPPDYQVPENINPVNYWDNETLESTENNRKKIIEGCVEADDDNWEGCLLNRLGFNVEDFIPRYGRQYNRFSPDTYNNPNPNIIQNSTKPLILSNELDGVINPALNLYYKFPLPGSGDTPNGVPKFLHGFNQNQEAIVALQSQPLTAANSPLLTNSSFFLIYSDIVAERNYQSGSTPLPCVFYAMKNYSNGGYLYSYGSNYNIMVNQDRLLSQINTEIRNPNDGKLAKLSPNSTIIYKIQRNTVVPNPNIDVFGKSDAAQNQPDPNREELDKIFNEEKKIAAAVGGSVPTAMGIRAMGNGGIAADRMRLRIKQNLSSPAAVAAMETQTQPSGEQALSIFMRQSEAPQSERKERDEDRRLNIPPIPEEIKERALKLVIQSLLNKLPVPRGTLTQNNLGLLQRSLRRLFATILADLDIDMESRWEAVNGDPEEFLEDLMEDLIENVVIGARGQILESSRRRGGDTRTAEQGVVFATNEGLTELAAILGDVAQGRLSEDLASGYLEQVLRGGGVLLERPDMVDSRGRGIARGEGAPITYSVINIMSGSELGSGGGGGYSGATPQYNPNAVLESLQRGLNNAVDMDQGGPAIEEYRDDNDSATKSQAEPQQSAPREPDNNRRGEGDPEPKSVQSESTEQFSRKDDE